MPQTRRLGNYINTDQTTTSNEFYVYDFCDTTSSANGTFEVQEPLSDLVLSYWSNWAGTGETSGYASVRIMQLADKSWSVVLYNFANDTWDQVYNSGSDRVTTPQNGIATTLSWLMLETHYDNGAVCPSLPEMEAANLNLLEYTGTGSMLTTVAPPSATQNTTEGSCFQADGSNMGVHYVWDSWGIQSWDIGYVGG